MMTRKILWRITVHLKIVLQAVFYDYKDLCLEILPIAWISGRCCCGSLIWHCVKLFQCRSSYRTLVHSELLPFMNSTFHSIVGSTLLIKDNVNLIVNADFVGNTAAEQKLTLLLHCDCETMERLHIFVWKIERMPLRSNGYCH